MAAVSETIVREYFELNGFLVRQPRKFIAPARHEEEEIDLFVINPQPRHSDAPLPFVLSAADLPAISRAIIVVKGWHTETFSQGLLASTPEIFRFVEPASLKRAVESLGDDGTLAKILVVPSLPQEAVAQQESIQLLKARGIDAVISFRTILLNLIEQTESNRNYQKSDLLQMIRVLKSYGLFKEPQLELFKPKRQRRNRAGNSGRSG